MNDTQTNIEKIVMRRVHMIRMLGLILSTVTLAALTLILALWGIGKEVWVARVFQNAPTDIANMPNFYLAAFTHARLVVQVLAVFSFASLVYLARRTSRAIALFLHPASN